MHVFTGKPESSYGIIKCLPLAREKESQSQSIANKLGLDHIDETHSP